MRCIFFAADRPRGEDAGEKAAAGLAALPAEKISGKIFLTASGNFVIFAISNYKKVMTEKSTQVCAAQRAGVW